jgi:hypothetical protein
MFRAVPLLLAAALLSCGCDAFKSKKTHVQKENIWSTLTPPDQVDPTEEGVDDWSFVANEARGNQMLEHDPDPWWQLNFMSEKARMIERNVGIKGPNE